MDFDPKVIEAVVLLIGGGALAVITNFIISFFKERRDARLATNKQAVDHFDLLAGRLEGRINTLENALKECQEHHTACESKLGEMTGRIDELRRQVQAIAPPGNGVNILMQGTGHPQATIEPHDNTDQVVIDG